MIAQSSAPTDADPQPPERQRSWPVRAAERVVPAENLSGVVYGIIAIGALLAAESAKHESYLDTVVSTVIAAALYWLAHANSKMLGGRLERRQRLGAAALAQAVAHDWAIMCGACLPLLALALAWIARAPLGSGVTAALWTAIASLVACELFAGIRARATPRELVLDASVGAAIGVGILLLRIVLH
ncbi:MAG: hypothetical protein ACRDJX_07790 [Solirubrobacteraceae bacterium]